MNDAWFSAAVVAPLLLLDTGALVFVITGLSDRRSRRAEGPARLR